MAKPLSLEAALAHLRELKQRSDHEISDVEVSELLGSKHNIVAAAGAEIVASTRRVSQAKQLLAAFDRFMKDPGRTDKGCLAKTAIVAALTALDERETEVFLRGVHHVQKEPSWGGSSDTAGELRGRCIVALAECGYPDAMLEIASLLMDSDSQARVGAVRAAGAVASNDAPALVRLKLLAGDDEPVVLGECCAVLLQLDAEKHAGFLAQFLDDPQSPPAQVAISALAECRHPAALAMLVGLYKSALTAEQRTAALTAIVELRIDGTTEFLLELIEHDLHPRAREVVAVLHPRKSDEPFRRKLASALERREDKLLARYAEEWLSTH